MADLHVALFDLELEIYVVVRNGRLQAGGCVRKVFFRNQFFPSSFPICRIAQGAFVVSNDGNIILTGLYAVVGPESGHFESAIFAEECQRRSRRALFFG